MNKIIILFFLIAWVFLPPILDYYKASKKTKKNVDSNNSKKVPVISKEITKKIEKPPEIKTLSSQQKSLASIAQNLQRKALNVKPLSKDSIVEGGRINVSKEKNNIEEIKNDDVELATNQFIVDINKESIRKAIIFSEILRSPFVDYCKK